MKTYTELLEDVGVERLDEASDINQPLKKEILGALSKAETNINKLGKAVLDIRPKKIRIEDFVEDIAPTVKKLKQNNLSLDEANRTLFKLKGHIIQLAKLANTPRAAKENLVGIDTVLLKVRKTIRLFIDIDPN